MKHNPYYKYKSLTNLLEKSLLPWDFNISFTLSMHLQCHNGVCLMSHDLYLYLYSDLNLK